MEENVSGCFFSEHSVYSVILICWSKITTLKPSATVKPIPILLHLPPLSCPPSFSPFRSHPSEKF